MKRKHIIGIIVLVTIAAIIFKLASNKKAIDKKEQPAQDSVVKIPVKTASVVQQVQDISMIKTGSLAPFIEAKVLSTVAGTIKELKFKLGDQIAEGQVLAIMDTKLLQLDLQKAESNAEKLRNDLQTYSELLQGQAATQEKVNEIRKEYLDAVNLVSQTKKQISDAIVKAPTSGTISTKLVEKGVFVTAGTEIATVVNLSQAKIQLSLTESEVYQVQLGQNIKITTDVYPGKEFKGSITFISPQADETHNYRIEILAENKEGSVLRSGTFVYADFSRKTSQMMLLIPREALTESIKDASVYIVEHNKVRLKSIKTGIESGEMIQVLEGLREGEQIVTSGQINLRDGAQVNISK